MIASSPTVRTRGARRTGPTPRDTLARDGTARLYRFRGPRRSTRPPLLIVPSLINRWYVVDLLPEASLAGALVERGVDAWALDWGVPEDEDRFRTWDEQVERVDRMVRRVRRETGQRPVVMGYSMGATLSAVWGALHPTRLAGLINLAGPIDFAHSGLVQRFVDPAFFDVEALTAGGNLPGTMMHAGLLALRPTHTFIRLLHVAEAAIDPASRRRTMALEAWIADAVPVPAHTYVTYIRDLYQDNALVEGRHRVRGETVDLGRITCPVLTIAPTLDHLCPPAAALALNEHVGSDDVSRLDIEAGHVGAVVGPPGPEVLYPAIADWMEERWS